MAWYLVEEEVVVTQLFEVEADSLEDAQDIVSQAREGLVANAEYAVVGTVAEDGTYQYGPVD